ncbi:hypothetical protein [Lentzea sp. NBRC 105346]|uniref:hypothetical protein n=1 Tax=Lentzea sp. NBRC 105346 TaxID=3032205 RepID=UPI002556C283|nr:hypothetical protein [Lentzea sp. NBRC 105346]
MDARTAKEIEAALAAEDRARTKRRKVEIRGVLRAAAKWADAGERGRVEVAAAEAALEHAKEHARAQQENAAADAGREVDRALEVFDDRELARFSGLSVSRLRQWRRAARGAAQQEGTPAVVDGGTPPVDAPVRNQPLSPASMSDVDDLV